MMTMFETEWIVPGHRAIEALERRGKGDTQHERIRRVLEGHQAGWVCGQYFLTMFIPTYSQRIGEMVRAGAPIERSRCADPNHEHESEIGAYRWV